MMEAQNDMLMRSILRKEVEEAKVQMVAGTTPGPNGFIVNFFHFF